jgi:hypothetical protein
MADETAGDRESAVLFGYAKRVVRPRRLRPESHIA